MDHGGFSTTNLLTTDQRGFARLVQEEAAGLIQENQVLLNATVTDVEHSHDGVTVALADGRRLSADYALVTFSLGVLQNDDVRFVPPLPDWKVEAIHGMTMVSDFTLRAICVKILMPTLHYHRELTPRSIYNFRRNSGSRLR